MVPAITTQWSDRQKELDLKTSLISRITGSAAIATQDTISLIGDEKVVGDEAKSPPIKDAAQYRNIIAAWRRQYRNTLKEWRVAASTLQSELHAYFPDTTLEGFAIDDGRCETASSQTASAPRCSLDDAFGLYGRLVSDYIRLSLGECPRDHGRRKAVGQIRSYFHGKLESVRWKFIKQPPRVEHAPLVTDCWLKVDDFRQEHQDLGGRVLNQRNQLVDALIASHAAGYNVGFGDFLHQVIPVY